MSTTDALYALINPSQSKKNHIVKCAPFIVIQEVFYLPGCGGEQRDDCNCPLTLQIAKWNAGLHVGGDHWCIEAIRRNPPNLTIYYRCDLEGTFHKSGCDNDQWSNWFYESPQAAYEALRNFIA